MCSSPRGFLIKLAFVIAVLPSIGHAALTSDEVVDTAHILSDPASYHLPTVTMVGTTENVRLLDPVFNYKFGMMCYGAYLFTLRDKAGTLEIEVPSICARTIESRIPVVEKEPIRVRVRLEAPGYYTGQGLTPGGEMRQVVRGIAVQIDHATATQ